MQILNSRLLFKYYQGYLAIIAHLPALPSDGRWLLIDGFCVHRFHPAETFHDLSAWICSRNSVLSALYRLWVHFFLLFARFYSLISALLSSTWTGLASAALSQVNAQPIFGVDTILLTHAVTPDDPLGLAPFKSDLSIFGAHGKLSLLVFDHFGFASQSSQVDSIPACLLSRRPSDYYGHLLWNKSLWMRLHPKRIADALFGYQLPAAFARLCETSYISYRTRVNLWQALRAFREIKRLKPRTIVFVAENHPFERYLFYLIQKYTTITALAYISSFVSSTSFLSPGHPFCNTSPYTRSLLSSRVRSSFASLSTIQCNSLESPYRLQSGGRVTRLCFICEGYINETFKALALARAIATRTSSTHVSLKPHPRLSYGVRRTLLSLLLFGYSVGCKHRILLTTQPFPRLKKTTDLFISSGSSAILDIVGHSAFAIFIEPGSPDLSPFWSIDSVVKFSTADELLKILLELRQVNNSSCSP